MTDGLMSCCFQEGAAASPCTPISKNVDAGIETAVASPVRHMHRDVAQLLQSAATTPRRRRRKMRAAPSAAAEARGRARYDCAFAEEAPAEEDGDGFAPARLVWVKVRGHPWWPGQVFDPSDASELALRERRKRRRDAVLVACFGDSTFLWADAGDLLPLRDGFPRLAEIGGRSTSTELLPSAVEGALDEVARRLEAGLSCGCCAASIMEMPVLPNSGVRRGARGAAVDAAFSRNAFRGEAFVGYVRALAVAPTAGADMLDLAIASAQLKAFGQWRRRSVAPPPDDAMVVAARASPGRATTPRRQRTRRGDRGGDAPPGEMAMSMCARAAAADAAFMREVFRGEAPEVYDSEMALTPAAFTRDLFHGETPEEYASAMSLTAPAASFERRDLAVCTMAQQNAFNQWMGAPSGIISEYTRDVFNGEATEEYGPAMSLTPSPAAFERRDLAVCTIAQRNAFNQWMGAPTSIITEYTATMDVPASGAMNAVTPPPVRRDTAKKTSSPGGDDADADPGNCRFVTSCISSREDSACENDGDDGSETESEDFEDGSDWGLEWKDYVILIQFVAIVLLVCQLMQ